MFDHIGIDHRWDFATITSVLTLNKTLSDPTQVIGTESTISNTWLWSWANTAREIPAEALTAANTLRKFGKDQAIDELSRPSVSLSEMPSSTLAVVATGLTRGAAYYCGGYDGGAIFLLIDPQHLTLPAHSEPTAIIQPFRASLPPSRSITASAGSPTWTTRGTP